jgi:hypothetical protein
MANENNQETQSVLWNWIAASLIASFVAGSIPTLLIFYVGFRYETEFVTALAMLALVGFCQSYFLFKNRLAQKGLTILGASLMIFSLLVNIALAYTGIYSFSS